MPRAGIALGSNLGDRLAQLRAARDLLAALQPPGSPAPLQARVHETGPVLCPPDSPPFLNTVVEIETSLGPAELLARTQAIERILGRAPGAARNAPRTIDIDLLYLGNEISAETGLELPHPRLGQRRFVLCPLAEIRPELVLPGDSRPVAARLADLRSDEPAPVPVLADW